MARVRGAEAVRVRLSGLTGQKVIRNVGKALFAAGDIIAAEASVSITRGSVSGKNHVPSAPGEPPNNDTGVLIRNIEVTQKAPLVVEVSSNAPYAAALEYGTSKMAARPYMRPARDAKAEEVRDLVARAVDASLGRRG